MGLIPENWGFGNPSSFNFGNLFYNNPQQGTGNDSGNSSETSSGSDTITPPATGTINTSPISNVIPMLPQPAQLPAQQVSPVLKLRASNPPPASVGQSVPKKNSFTEAVDNLVKPQDYARFRLLFDKITPEQTREKIYPNYSNLMNISGNKILLEELIVILYIQCKNYVRNLFILRSTVNVKQDGQYNLSIIIDYIHKCKDTIKLIDEISNKIKNIIGNYPTLTINTPIGKNLDYIENLEHTYNNLYDEAIRLYFYHSDTH